jgi:hypothetical protein
MNNSACKLYFCKTVRCHLWNSVHKCHEFSFISFGHVCHSVWFSIVMLPDIVYLRLYKILQKTDLPTVQPLHFLPIYINSQYSGLTSGNVRVIRRYKLPWTNVFLWVSRPYGGCVFRRFGCTYCTPFLGDRI